jgi:diacylglycerol kinase (ATP)
LDNSNNRRLIFKTRSSENISSDIILKGNPVDIICQNIDFYMGGTQNIWDKSSDIGITKDDTSSKQYKKQVLESFQKQAFDDKKIEFFTYEHGIELGLEKVARGIAKRVYQGSGPVFLEFKKNPDETEKIALQKVYLNCDGEFYHLVNPMNISVRLNSNICDGQINILKNEKGF